MSFNFFPPKWIPLEPLTPEHWADLKAYWTEMPVNVHRWTLDWPCLFYTQIPKTNQHILVCGVGILVHQVRPDLAARDAVEVRRTLMAA